MKREITYNELWIVEQDVLLVKKNLPSVYLVNEQRFLTLVKRNEAHFRLMHKRMHEIQLRYIVHDEEKNPVRAIPQEGQEATGEWEFLGSTVDQKGQLLVGEEVKNAYYQEADEFLKRSITIEL